MTLTSYEQGMVRHQDWSICTPVLGAPWSYSRVFSSTFNNEETMKRNIHEIASILLPMFMLIGVIGVDFRIDPMKWIALAGLSISFLILLITRK